VKGDLISLLDPTAGRQTLGNACDMNTGRSKHFGKVVGGCLPLDIHAQRQDDLRGTLLTHPFDQFGNPELLGPDTIQRGEFSTERVISPTKDSRPLKRENVRRRFNDAEFTPRPPFIQAKKALLLFGKKTA
jgi:hypothetical protein